MGRKKQSGALGKQVPEFDLVRASELIEACRAHVANLTTLAGISSRTLFECYEHQGDEPELWQCCSLVRQVLRQTQRTLTQLGVVSHETAPLTRAQEIAVGCEAQRQWLRPAVHVIRATIHVLLDVKSDFHDEVLPPLRDLENGLSNVVNELQCVIQCCPCRAGGEAAR